jgi:hypothetical protein
VPKVKGVDMKEDLIAPCGMNCGVCVSYLSMKHDLNSKGLKRVCCDGCLPRGKNCLHMGGACVLLKEGHVRFCYECGDFPCKRLKALDKRYRTKYHLSMIENLTAIKETGLENFLKRENEKWRCPDCGGTVCCHIGLCLNCQLDILRQNRTYRWGGGSDKPRQ